MVYNPYSAVNAIYNLKNEWDTANKAGDIEKRDKAAQNAQTFYNQLKSNGYGNVADELSSVDVNGAKYILDQYSTKNSGVDNQAYSTSMKSATDKNNTLAGYIDSDRKDVQGKYNAIYGYANQDITKTDEYKSTYNSIMGKYDLSALQGRDNAVASGGASNGGNIDSYSAANAMRQQAALTATGQQIAHQAGLDAYNARVSNVSNILNNLGVYNSSTYDAMNQTVANDRGIANDYFNNAETAKNNEVARLSEQANVTGYTPTEWTIKNDAIYSDFLNSDGTFKKEKEGIDIQALIDRAKASGDTETANKLAVVRYKKMMGNWDAFGQYANTGDVASFKNQKTEAGRQFDSSMDYNYKALDSNENLTKEEIAAKERMNNANNQNNLDQIEATALYSQAATGQITEEHKDKVAEDINTSYKNVLGENIITKVGDKYVVKNNYGGAVARYMMSQYFKDAYQTAAWMQAMFGTPPEDTAVALGLTKGNKPHDWEKPYNPNDYKLN